jgi:hypothetical protein
MWRALPGVDLSAPEHLLRDGLLLLAAPLWLYAITWSVRTQAHLRQARVAWLAGALVATLYGLWMWLWREGIATPRVPSALDDVNSYGSYLVLSLFMAIVVLADDRRRAARVLAGLSVPATVWMLILAGSRIALMAAIGAATAVAMLALPRRRWVVAVAAIVLTVATVAGLRLLGSATDANYYLRLVYNSTDPGRLASHFVENRQSLWSASARAFLGHPLAGIGPGRLYPTLGDYYRPGDPGFRPRNEHAHNYFLQLAAETGVVGIIAFVWLLASVLVSALRDPAGGLAGRRILAIGALSYLATCLAGHPLILSRQVVLFWGFVGLLGAASPALETASLSTARAVRWSTWALVPIVLVAISMAPPQRPCTSPDGVGIAYGLGFYPADSTPTGSWRWMDDAGEVRLCNSTASPVTVDLTVPAASFAVPRTVSAYIGSRRLARYTVGPPEQTLTLPSISLPPGWTTVGIVATPGPLRVDPIVHNGDQRTISIGVGEPSISVEPTR